MSWPEIGEDELQAFIDGQLPEGRCPDVLAHLGQHAHDLQRVSDYAGHKDQLRRRLEALDLATDDPTTARLQRALADRLARPRYIGWLRRASAVALLLAAGWSAHALYQNYLENRIPELVIKAAEAHQVFGGDRRRPVELTAASTAEMASWFSSRLGEPVEIPVLATIGLRLVGGRLLAAGDQPMAQLIYEDKTGHRLTLCLSSEPAEAGQEVELIEVGDLTAGYWHDGDLTYALVAETPELGARRDRIGAWRGGARGPPVGCRSNPAAAGCRIAGGAGPDGRRLIAPPGAPSASKGLLAGRQSATQGDVGTMSLLGLLCFLLAALDLATALVGLPLTSVEWSPMVFMLLGGLFLALGALPRGDRPST